MNLKSLAGTAGPSLIFALLAAPAFANIVACASGNLSTIDYTTCDIGNLQFTFTGFQSANYLYNPLIPGSGVSVPWTDSDFTFTVLSDGFELSGLPAQTVATVPGGQGLDSASLGFTVVDLNGSITGLNVTGGNVSVSGPGTSGNSYADNSLDICGTGLCYLQEFSAENVLYDFSGNIENGLGDYTSIDGPMGIGYGGAVPFDLFAANGYTASIDSTATDFTFTTGSAPPVPPPTISQVPEPRLLALLSISILGLVCAIRLKLHR